MSTLFPNHIIFLKKGLIYSLRKHKFATNIDKDGYHCCYVKDKFGNIYTKVHQVIISEGLQLPKNEWQVDKNGERYVVDHIIPIKNGGTDSFDNLHLIPKEENSRNPKSIINYSNAAKGEKNSFFGKKHTESTKKRISVYRKGQKLKEETKKKISEKLKGRKSPNSKTVYQYSMDNKLICKWSSIIEIQNKLQYSRDGIGDCCNGKRESYKGYKWSYQPL